MGEPSNSDWLGQWQAFARQYSNAWQDLARNATATAAPAATPPGFEAWSRMFPAQGAQAETVERLVESARGYASFLQSTLGALGGAQGAPAWSEAVLRGFSPDAATQAAFTPPFAAIADAFGTAMQPGSASAELKNWLNLPAFGLMREHQEHYRDSALAWIDYQEQQKRYGTLMMKAAKRGFELFEGKLSEREQPGRQIDSLRGLYDLWVDAAEEGYAEIALSTEFREAYGALVNAQMRVRSQLAKEVERVAAELGMPTRSEVDSIGERLQALRREVRAASGRDRTGLAAEVAALREEVAALKSARRAPSRAEVVPEPAVPVKAKPARSPRARAKGKARAKLPAAATKRTQRPATSKGRAPRAARSLGAKAKGNFAARIASFADASREAPKPGALRSRRDKNRAHEDA